MLFTPLKPMLLHFGKKIEDNEDWLYDLKWDGWRLLIHKQGNRIEAYTRHGNVVTNHFPELQLIAQQIKSHTAILDCEGVVLRNCISVFEDFAYRARLNNQNKIDTAVKTHPVSFIAFDILATDKDLTKLPLFERKQILSSIVEPSNQLVVSPYSIGRGTDLFNLTKEKGMEGIVGKRINSSYQLNRRSHDWLKFKHFKTMDTVILGYKESPFTMIVGNQFENGIKPVASIEFGFKPEEKTAFRKVAEGIATKQEKDIIWVEPVLCCSVQYMEKTENNSLRIASFKGFNFNKDPKDCTWSMSFQ